MSAVTALADMSHRPIVLSAWLVSSFLQNLPVHGSSNSNTNHQDVGSRWDLLPDQRFQHTSRRQNGYKSMNWVAEKSKQ